MVISNQILEFPCLCIYLGAAGNLRTVNFAACNHKTKQGQDTPTPQTKKTKKKNLS